MGQTDSAPMGEYAPRSKMCKPCGAWDKQISTVKVDGAALANKDNAGPTNSNSGNTGDATTKVVYTKEEREELQRRREQEAQQKMAQQAEQQRKEMERRVQEEQERQQAEERRLEVERRRQQQEQLAREQLLRAQEEERLRQDALRREEEAKAAAAAAAAAEQALQEVENQKKMQAWLQANGFKNVNEMVRKRMSKTRPLHVAVQQNDAELVKLMLTNGANPRFPNGKKELPLQLAQRLNKAGSHEAVIRAFEEQQNA